MCGTNSNLDRARCNVFHVFVQTLSRIKRTINIAAFIDACKGLNVPEEEVCLPPALYCMRPLTIPNPTHIVIFDPSQPPPMCDL